MILRAWCNAHSNLGTTVIEMKRSTEALCPFMLKFQLLTQVGNNPTSRTVLTSLLAQHLMPAKSIWPYSNFLSDAFDPNWSKDLFQSFSTICFVCPSSAQVTSWVVSWFQLSISTLPPLFSTSSPTGVFSYFNFTSLWTGTISFTAFGMFAISGSNGFARARLPQAGQGHSGACPPIVQRTRRRIMISQMFQNHTNSHTNQLLKSTFTLMLNFLPKFFGHVVRLPFYNKFSSSTTNKSLWCSISFLNFFCHVVRLPFYNNFSSSTTNKFTAN